MLLYHVMNRGVDKRNIFLDDSDRVRFVHGLWAFNDREQTLHAGRIVRAGRERGPDRLVDIHGWCLMDNHYHLLVSEAVDGGLTQFLRKTNIAYAKSFDQKYEREGALFQGRTKRVLIENDAHFLHILHYIHLNPLDHLDAAKDWRGGVVTDARLALQYLESYRWSSYLDYCGTRNFPSIITMNLFANVFDNYAAVIREFIVERECFVPQKLTLE